MNHDNGGIEDREFSSSSLGKRTDRYRSTRRFKREAEKRQPGLRPPRNRKKIIMTAAVILLVAGACAGLFVLWRSGNLGLPFGGGNGSDEAVMETAYTDTAPARALSSQQRALAGMTLEQKIGQMMMVGFEGQSAGSEIWSLVSEKWIGSVVLYDRNISSPQQAAELNDSLQEAAVNAGQPYRLMVATDQEGGKTRRFISIPPDYSEPDTGAMGDAAADTARKQAVAAAQGLKQIGINTNLAPVVDVSDGEGSVMDLRSFGTDPAEVSMLGSMAVNGYESAGMISCPKHFPGHGSADADSHDELPHVDSSREQLTKSDLPPFNAAINSGAPMIMVGHLVVPALDPSGLPASLSKPVMTELLRKQMGFKGVIIIDDLEMGAIADNYGIGEAAVMAVGAGADMVIVAHTYDEQLNVYEALLAAAKSGRLSGERIDESVLRILEMKAKYIAE